MLDQASRPSSRDISASKASRSANGSVFFSTAGGSGLFGADGVWTCAAGAGAEGVIAVRD